MAGPLALVPAAITFAKTQAAKFLAKRAALRTAPKIKNLVNGKGKNNVGGLTKNPPKTSVSKSVLVSVIAAVVVAIVILLFF